MQRNVLSCTRKIPPFHEIHGLFSAQIPPYFEMHGSWPMVRWKITTFLQHCLICLLLRPNICVLISSFYTKLEWWILSFKDKSLHFVRTAKNFSNPSNIRARREWLRSTDVPALPEPASVWPFGNGTISKMALKSAGTSVLRNRFSAGLNSLAIFSLYQNLDWTFAFRQLTKLV